MSNTDIFGKSIAFPVSRALRRMRWFNVSFDRHLKNYEAKTGIVFDVSDEALARVFLDWSRRLVAQKPRSPALRKSFVRFSAGLMLRELIDHSPATRRSAVVAGEASEPESFWPEGHLYVSYCLTMRDAVLQEEYGDNPARSKELADVRSWHSFRENMTEDSALAIPFLDLFAGEVPEWTARDIFSCRNDASPGQLAASPQSIAPTQSAQQSDP